MFALPCFHALPVLFVLVISVLFFLEVRMATHTNLLKTSLWLFVTIHAINVCAASFKEIALIFCNIINIILIILYFINFNEEKMLY